MKMMVLTQSNNPPEIMEVVDDVKNKLTVYFYFITSSFEVPETIFENHLMLFY
jgi:hypothetical protein